MVSRLCSNVFGIQPSRQRLVGGVLHDRPPVRKDNHLPTIDIKMQHELVIGNLPHHLKASLELLEREPFNLGIQHLHGILTTKRGGSNTKPSVEELVCALASGAIVARSGLQPIEAPRPDVDTYKLPVELPGSNEYLYRLGGLQGADNERDWADYPGSITGQNRPSSSRSRAETPEAGGFTGDYSHRHPEGRDGPAINPRDLMLQGNIIYQKAGLKIIQSVKDYVSAADKPFDVGIVYIRNYPLNFNR